jgi:phospholipase C
VRVESGGEPGGISALLVAALESAVKQTLNSFEVEQKLNRYAKTFLGWVLGDRNAAVQGTRASVSLYQVGTRPGPLLLSSGLGNEAQPPLNPGNLGKIDHIVVVMMENRSFDHMLGYLSLPTTGNAGRVGAGRINVDGLTGSESNPIDVRGGRIQVFPLTNKRLSEDPGHSFSFARTQRGNFGISYFDTPGGGMPNPPANVDADEWIERFKEAHQHEFRVGPNQGFVLAHARRLLGSYPALKGADFTAARAAVMGYYTAAQLPTYHYLAENFGICDRWFAAHPGHTWPNRFISLTGALILGPDGKPQFDNPSLEGFEPLATSTIFDHLSTANVPWRCYEHNFCFLRLFKRYTTDRERVRQYLPAPLLGEAGFAADVRSGRWLNAPSVTFIEPRLIDISPANANDDHPPADVGNGQRFIREVIDSLQARPEVWAKTLLLITYDENGGFHDHVHAPQGEVNPMFIDPLTNQPVTYRGFRVPAFVASPFVPARAVSHEIYDHTSILKTIMARFLSQTPPNMGPRVAAAQDVGSMLELARPRALSLRPPTVAAVRKKSVSMTSLDDDDFRRFLSGFRDKFAQGV